MKRKQFSSVEFLPLSIKELSYATPKLLIEKHTLNLDKQLFCLEIFNFIKNNENDTFTLNIIQGSPRSIRSDNTYEPPIFLPSYGFYLFKNNQKQDNILDSFNNYSDSLNEHKILYWIIKHFSENRLNYEENNLEHMHSFEINKKSIDILMQDAYQENYVHIQKEHLESILPKNNNNTKKPKI